LLLCRVFSCIFAHGVELNVSQICKKCVSLLEMSKVYDSVVQPSYICSKRRTDTRNFECRGDF